MSYREGRTTLLKTIKILCAQANESVLHTVQQLLEFEGWSVEACQTGPETLRKLESSEKFDLIILDDELPGLAGLEVLRRARRITHRRRTPIIIFSTNDCEREARAARADAFLRKPSGVMELVQTATHHLRSGRSEKKIDLGQNSGNDPFRHPRPDRTWRSVDALLDPINSADRRRYARLISGRFRIVPRDASLN